MDIPKFIGVVYDFTFDGDPHSTHIGNSSVVVAAETMAEYNDLVQTCRGYDVPESDIEQIGWDIYASTRASANSPGAVNHGFEGPEVTRHRGPTAEWKQYKRKGLSEMRPWAPGDDMTNISVSESDKLNGSPKPGDMIARNPKNNADQWLVAAKYFADNLEPA